MLNNKDSNNLKQIFKELDKLQPSSFSFFSNLNEFEFFILKKVIKEKKVKKSDFISVISVSVKSRAQKYRGIKNLLEKKFIIENNGYLQTNF